MMRLSGLLSSRFGSLLMLLVPMILSTKVHAVIQPDCVNPLNSLGRCIDVKFCVSIMTALINNDHKTNPEVSKFLRESQCGIEQNSHKVCCDVRDIDFGTNEKAKHDAVETTTRRFTTKQPDFDVPNCGALRSDETLLKWIAELWFSTATRTGTERESKCLGTLIAPKHVVVPAHCIASLPANLSLDFVRIRGHEFYASSIFIHASYNQPKFANDIAIIELDKGNDSEINDAVCLPRIDDEQKSTIAVVKRANEALKFGKALYSASTECTSYFNQQLTELTPGQFCANVQSNETAYSPFIGAIAIDVDTKRRYTFKGFSSTLIRTGQAFDESRPYIFTDIAHHLNWIKAAIGGEKSLDESKQSLQSCTTGEADNGGFCVLMHQCSIYRDAPQPLSESRKAFLDNAKCSTGYTGSNSIEDDGICCAERYIDLNATSSEFDFDVRFHNKRGIELLDMHKCGTVLPSKRVVGGTQADLKEFPWIGLIKYKVGRSYKFTCGASLISNRFVLTCAHCITKLPPGYHVDAIRLGEFDRTTDPDCRPVDEYDDESEQECNPPVQDISIEKLLPHPNYNTPRYANDIGLVRLTQKPDMSQGIIPICLPISSNMQKTVVNKYTVAGFGFTERGSDSDVLLKIALPKVSKESCQSMHGRDIKLSEGHECYGGEGITDSCKGDSGSPLMNYVNLNGSLRSVQMGLVVAGHTNCGQGVTGFPGIYSDINYYLEWILDNLYE